MNTMKEKQHKYVFICCFQCDDVVLKKTCFIRLNIRQCTLYKGIHISFIFLTIDHLILTWPDLNWILSKTKEETLPKAQRTRGLISYNKFKHKQWNFNFKIFTKPCAQSLNKSLSFWPNLSFQICNKLLPTRSSSETTTSTSFELASLHARVTSIKFTKQELVSELVTGPIKRYVMLKSIVYKHVAYCNRCYSFQSFFLRKSWMQRRPIRAKFEKSFRTSKILYLKRLFKMSTSIR